MSRPPKEQAAAPKVSAGGAASDPWSREGQGLVTPDAVSDKLSDQPKRATSVVGAEPQRVVVTEIAVPFGSLVRFGVKLVLAAVPALILLLLILAGLFAIAGTLLGGAIMAMVTSAFAQAVGWFGWPW